MDEGTPTSNAVNIFLVETLGLSRQKSRVNFDATLAQVGETFP